MNVVGVMWKCRMLAYGHGDSRLDHAPNEHCRWKNTKMPSSISKNGNSFSIKGWFMKIALAFLVVSLVFTGQLAAQSPSGTEWVLHEGNETFIQAPPTWFNITTPELFEKALKQVEDDPVLTRNLQAAEPTLQNTSDDLSLFEPDKQVMIWVEVNTSEPDETLSDLQFFNGAVLQNLGEVVGNELVSLPAGLAVWTTVLLTPPPEQPNKHLVNTSVDLLQNGKNYTIVGLTLQEDYFEVLPIYMEMFRSFGIGSAPSEISLVTQPSWLLLPAGKTILSAQELTAFSSFGEAAYVYSTDRFQIAAPVTWIDLADDAAIAKLEALSLTLPDDFHENIDQLRHLVESNPFSINLVLLDPNTGSSAFVSFLPMEQPVALADYAEALPGQLGAAGTITSRSENIELPIGNALQLEMTDTAGQYIAFIFNHGTEMYLILYYAPSDQFATMRPVYLDMMQSFRFIE